MYETKGACAHVGWDRGSHVCMRPEVHVFMRVGTEVAVCV